MKYIATFYEFYDAEGFRFEKLAEYSILAISESEATNKAQGIMESAPWYNAGNTGFALAQA